MNYPNLITNQFLASVAASDEQMMVRLIIRHVANQSTYVLHGRKNRHYHFAFDRTANAHILNVPLSVWMDGVRADLPAHENHSIAWDICGKKHGCGSPIIIMVPWTGASGEVASEAQPTCRLSEFGRQAVGSIDTLAKTLEAPEIVHRAIGLILDPALPDSDVETFLADVQAEAEAMMKDEPEGTVEADTNPSPAAGSTTADKPSPSADDEAKRKARNEQAKERMRRMRAAKKATAKKAATKRAGRKRTTSDPTPV